MHIFEAQRKRTNHSFPKRPLTLGPARWECIPGDIETGYRGYYFVTLRERQYSLAGGIRRPYTVQYGLIFS